MTSNSTLGTCDGFPHIFDQTLWSYFSVSLTLSMIINCSILAIVGNTVVGCLIYSTRRLWTKKHILVMNLVFVDLLTATVSIPFYATFLILFVQGEPPCYLRTVHIVASNITFTMTVINLSLISYERFIAVLFPYRYQALLTAPRLVLVAAASWLYGCVLAVPALGKVAWPCDYRWQPVSHAANAIVCVHVLSSLVCHGRLCRIACGHRRPISPEAAKSVRRLSKGARTSLYIVAAFLVCSLPSCVAQFVPNHSAVEVDYIVRGCSYLSCGLNWLIYTLRSQEIQTVIAMKAKRRIDTTIQPSEVGGRRCATHSTRLGRHTHN